MASALTVDVRIQDMEWFEGFANIVKEMTDDERICAEIREEYRGKINSFVDTIMVNRDAE